MSRGRGGRGGEGGPVKELPSVRFSVATTEEFRNWTVQDMGEAMDAHEAEDAEDAEEAEWAVEE